MDYYLASASMIASLIPLVALIFRFITYSVFKNKSKEITIRDNKGGLDTIIVSAASDKYEINKIVFNTIKFEDQVFKSLSNISKDLYDFKIEKNNDIDFIIEINGKKIGIESKYSINRIPLKRIKNFYEKNHKNLDKIIIFSQDVPNVDSDEINKNFAKLSFAYINNEFSLDKQLKSEILKNIINI